MLVVKSRFRHLKKFKIQNNRYLQNFPFCGINIKKQKMSLELQEIENRKLEKPKSCK